MRPRALVCVPRARLSEGPLAVRLRGVCIYSDQGRGTGTSSSILRPLGGVVPNVTAPSNHCASLHNCLYKIESHGVRLLLRQKSRTQRTAKVAIRIRRSVCRALRILAHFNTRESLYLLSVPWPGKLLQWPVLWASPTRKECPWHV